MKKKIILFMNILIVAFTLLGLGIMLYRNGAEGELLTSSGWANLKYFTVLSNIFCGIVAAIFMITQVLPSRKIATETVSPVKNPSTYPAWIMTLKLAATAAVSVTFLVVACFFGPIYGYGMLYLGSNLFFHLIIPLLGMVEFCLLDGDLPFRNTFLAGAPALLYGCVYLGNILINGKGEWPHTNDWYGFMNWGYGPAAMIFAGIVLTSWGVSCLLRKVNRLVASHGNK